MGWLYMQSTGSFKGPKQYLDNQFTYERPDSAMTSKVLKSALCEMRTYYAAVEHVIDGKREVFAVVCLVNYNKRAKDGYVFGYKDMDETMGPCERNCPASILDMLTPTEAPYAIAWRASCRKRIEKVQPIVGDVIVFEAPVLFSNGKSHARFELVQPWWNKKLVRLMALDGAGGLYRIPRWKERNFKIEEKADAQV
jgi:hypothetical protein